MKEEWLFPNAVVPVNVETTAALVAEIHRLIDVVGGMALAQPEQPAISDALNLELNMTDEYTYETYDMARFHIPDGMYSIEEIEKTLVHMKAAKKRQDEYLKQSIQPLKEKNE